MMKLDFFFCIGSNLFAEACGPHASMTPGMCAKPGLCSCSSVSGVDGASGVCEVRFWFCVQSAFAAAGCQATHNLLISFELSIEGVLEDLEDDDEHDFPRCRSAADSDVL